MLPLVEPLFWGAKYLPGILSFLFALLVSWSDLLETSSPHVAQDGPYFLVVQVTLRLSMLLSLSVEY